MEERNAYERARRRAEKKYGFYVHLAVYVAVNSLLLVINLVTYSGSYWFIWPLLGWGIGVLLHGLAVLLHSPGKTAIIDRMTEKELRKERPREP
jgi:hypothetical protein